MLLRATGGSVAIDGPVHGWSCGRIRGILPVRPNPEDEDARVRMRATRRSSDPTSTLSPNRDDVIEMTRAESVGLYSNPPDKLEDLFKALDLGS
jgi:hypothetical protein